MGRKRSLWSFSMGPYGDTVRIYEPSLGSALRFDYGETVPGPDGPTRERRRPHVEPKLYIRPGPNAPVDPMAERRAKELLREKARELNLVVLRQESEPERITVGDAYRMYFNPRRRALPKSHSAQVHHTGSRKFWEDELGADTVWDAVRPADVKGAIERLIETGAVASAEKRFHNLRTLYRWLRDDMGYDQLRDPTRGIKLKPMIEGYEPRRPRYSPDESRKMVATAARIGSPRERLFAAVTFDAGARGGQVRLALRSGFNKPLVPEPPAGMAPHGWLFLPAMKHQLPRLVFLTARSRAAIDAAIAAYPPEWEAGWLERQEDYPLVPGGEWPFGVLKQPITDEAVRAWWPKLEKAAGVPSLPRRGFHGARRRWADSTTAQIGREKTAHAGGWLKQDTLEEIYLSRYQYGDLEAARVANEEGS